MNDHADKKNDGKISLAFLASCPPSGLEHDGKYEGIHPQHDHGIEKRPGESQGRSSIATLGFAWVLSATGVYVRDISQVTGIITTVLLFVSPVFYPVSALPIEYRGWLLLNPLTFVIEEARNVLIWGRVIDWPRWGISVLAGLTIAWVGFWWFQKVRKGFADVL